MNRKLTASSHITQYPLMAPKEHVGIRRRQSSGTSGHKATREVPEGPTRPDLPAPQAARRS
ncbi:hypothetical protein CONPUDRAFT_134979 [Coniophora puteana RWD-64-598 SS2]|uniref:Uncharacterized protein n=1 Tax=Coniophora puteana (strain RWD-64-598) TaxID=741705 RepID=A0A5M3N2B3_CONPW|nr:uncharacterized protein CONPUDRAFT_134979 [Coniophora puteana RWD-64-598 SS2]EIW85154.1 hypothetical protein CONPUDRAFT_134979 [Coniophora puteana RWD-64-598 SS2]